MHFTVLPRPDGGLERRASCRDANDRCRMHGGRAPGVAKGNSKALKHGGYAVEAIAARRHLTALCDRLEASLTATGATRRHLADALLAEALAAADALQIEAAE